MQQPIAILDSGVGGLTVAKEVMRQLPHEKIIYFGDTARTPYGPRPPAEIIRFTQEIVDYVMQYRPKIIVIACNTATAVALESIQAQVEIPVIGVVRPGARAAIAYARTGRVGVIGTEGTIRSGAYARALKELQPDIECISLACPTFVPLVEQGRYLGDEAFRCVEKALAPLKQQAMDCLILGCTHYPFLADAIARVMGPDVRLISSTQEATKEIHHTLLRETRLWEENTVPVHHLFCSGDAPLFKRISSSWLAAELKLVSAVWQVPHLPHLLT